MLHRNGAPSGFSAPVASPASQEWDALRRDARKLEGELDVKLAAYAKLCGSYDGVASRSGGPGGGPSTDQLVRSKGAEIDGLLQRLSDVNDRLGGAASGEGPSHALTRHRDILHEFGQEARRLHASVGAARDRAELLSGVGEGTPLLGVQVQGALLRERNTILSSTSAVDDVIGTAQAVSSDLKAQRGVFEGIQDRLHTVGARFPVVNGLLKAIARKKSKDTIVLSTVIAICILVLIVYLWRR